MNANMREAFEAWADNNLPISATYGTPYVAEQVEPYEIWQAAHASRDEEVRRLREALEALCGLDVRGHKLLDRLQFSTEGRGIIEQVKQALGDHDGN